LKILSFPEILPKPIPTFARKDNRVRILLGSRVSEKSGDAVPYSRLRETQQQNQNLKDSSQWKE
jgi:hypothetical protein